MYFTAVVDNYYEGKKRPAKPHATPVAALKAAKRIFAMHRSAIIRTDMGTIIAELKSDALDHVWIEVTAEGCKYL